LFAMVLILFVGGLVVSTKVGGGGDLHDVDAYMVMLALVMIVFWANQVSLEKEAKPSWGWVSWSVVLVALLIPLWFAIPKIGFFHTYDKTVVEQDIQKIQDVVSRTLQNGGEVLLITERQLLSFNNIDGVVLIPQYEQTELMEMAMSRNRLYLEQYYEDL